MFFRIDLFCIHETFHWQNALDDINMVYVIPGSIRQQASNEIAPNDVLEDPEKK